MTNPVSTKALEKRYGSNVVLRGIDLDVPAGAIYALIGSNGVGKTTTLRVLTNIQRPSAGDAWVLGTHSTKLGPADFERIGYVSENQQMPNWMTVAAFLDYCRGFYPAWDPALASTLAERFRLPADRKLKALSRGMRMKAALASSLAYRPELVLLDEPFGGMDPVARDEFIEGVLEWSPGATTLICSHDLAEIESFTSHIGFLDEGRLLFSEETGSLVNRFREIQVTVDGEAVLPPALPATWLVPRVASAVVRFVDAQYDAARSAAEIRERFRGVRDVTAEAMSLRSIFVALARSSRVPV